MCTAISFNACNHYFGRNLDLESRYDESITIVPRNFEFKYSNGEGDTKHFAIIGTATVIDNYPLYYDAMNEYGLCIAGLNFVGNTYLNKNNIDGKINLAPYELIPYILSKCRNVDESIDLLKQIVLVDVRFKPELGNAELHWVIADKFQCITFEYMKEGSKIHINDVGVLTNNPPFEYQMMNLNNYMQLSVKEPKNRFSFDLELYPYSRGMGALGLPGDNSSMSRFVRATFNKLNSIKPNNEIESVVQFFHILNSVEQVKGSVIVGDKYECTQYASCCNTDKGIYYYKTYENYQINAINMHSVELDDYKLTSYKMIIEGQISKIN